MKNNAKSEKEYISPEWTIIMKSLELFWITRNEKNEKYTNEIK